MMEANAAGIINELQILGCYKTAGTWYGDPYIKVPKLNTPITPKENMKRYLAGADYCWLPDSNADVFNITPHLNPDVDASDYTGGADAFGVVWEALETGMPAMVRPGNPVLKDITEWQSLKWPDVDSWDWEGGSKEYGDAVSDGRYNRCTILTGFFERLISLMDFEGAAMALVMEPEAVSAFFDKLADFNISVAEHYKKYFNADGIIMHDDWASQRSAFFSLSTVRELIVPHLKRLVDRVHELGMSFTLHSCGNGADLAPAMIEAGADMWQFQSNAVDYEKALPLYGPRLKMETYCTLPFEGEPEQEVKAFITQSLETFCGDRNGICLFFDFLPEREFDLHGFIYSESRKAVLERGSAK